MENTTLVILKNETLFSLFGYKQTALVYQVSVSSLKCYAPYLFYSQTLDGERRELTNFKLGDFRVTFAERKGKLTDSLMYCH